jgi:N-acetylglutamate synthase-like GNAT family acetyltransferase
MINYIIHQTKFDTIKHFANSAGRERVLIFNQEGAVWFAAFITRQSKMIPIGCACCVIKGQSALFRGIFVQKSYRRHGVFRALFKEQLRYCQSLGLKELTANCTPLSLPEFLANGFNKVGNYKNSKTITIVKRVI